MIGAPDEMKKRHIVNQTAQRAQDDNFGHYLAGLWEGDGHIWIPKNKINSPHFCITFHEKEYPLVQKQKNILGGFIRHKRKNSAYVQTIASKIELLNIVNQIDGKQRTPKIYKFIAQKKWQGLEDHRLQNTETAIAFDSNAWQAGFIDADGSFDASVRKNGRIIIRFRLEQRMFDSSTDQPYEPIQRQISEEFKQNQTQSIHAGKSYWLQASQHNSNLEIQNNYLKVYPLFTSKRIKYDYWSKSLIMMRKIHRSEYGRCPQERERQKDFIKKNQVEYNNQQFNWTFLDNFGPHHQLYYMLHVPGLWKDLE